MNKRLDRQWNDDRLPSVIYGKTDLDILNDEFFSKMIFTFKEHTCIDQAKSGSKKATVFFIVLQRCPEAVINTFRELCYQLEIPCSRGKCFAI